MFVSKIIARRAVQTVTSCARLSLFIMASHSKLQVYRKHHVTTCVTGLFGCRWKRYQQSTAGTRPVDFVNYSYFLVTLLLVTLCLYFWIIGKNDYDDMAWHLFHATGKFLQIYSIILGVICVLFCYVCLLFILSICHVALGYQLYLHWMHSICLTLVLAYVLTSTVMISNEWDTAGDLFRQSFLITGPFLHMVLVFTATVLAWFLFDKILQIHRIVLRAAWLSLYAVVLILIYILPVFISSSPCICETAQLPSKPALFAHRGASGYAPENTKYSLSVASQVESVITLEGDISISYDGVPFLMHDETLKRTTNVGTVFPQRIDDLCSSFNFSDLVQLDAGSWFLQADPHGTVSRLSQSQKDEIRQQRVPALADALEIIIRSNKSFLFDIDESVAYDHPYYATYADVIIKTLINSGMPQKKVLWLYNDIFNTSEAHNFTLVGGKRVSVEEILLLPVHQININYGLVTEGNVKLFKAKNMSINVWTANVNWLFSILWCLGIDSVTTNFASHFDKVSSPVWHFTPGGYAALAIITDVISAVIIVAIFLRTRRRRDINHPLEVYTLRVAQHRQQQRTMKEKLISMTKKQHGGVEVSLDDLGGDIEADEVSTSEFCPDIHAEHQDSSGANSSVNFMPQTSPNLEFSNRQYAEYTPRLEIMIGDDGNENEMYREA